MIRAFQAESVVAAVPQLARGRVWCRQCGFTMTVDSAECLRSGWPKCHGETMTIDSPGEWRRRERVKIHLSVDMPWRKGTFCGPSPRMKTSKKPEQVTCINCLKNFAAWMKRETEG